MSEGPHPELVALAVAVGAAQRAPERILQIECGEGQGVLFLAREFPAARVRGVDRSSEAVAAAKATAGLDPEGRVAFKRQDARRLPYPDENFDLVVQTRAPLHLREIARVLREGGQLIVVDPEPSRASALRGLLRRRCLRRRGFALEREQGAGDGKFLLARRDDRR